MGLFAKIAGLFKRRSDDLQPDTSIDVAYVTWSCVDDTQSCKWCRELDGFSWLPHVDGPDSVPARKCSSKVGCRCILAYVLRSEMGAEETAAFLQANGGSASGQQLDEFANQRDSIAQERSEREHAAAEKAQRARQLEKTAPQDAATLYRECIEFSVENARESEDPWAWNHVPYLYNRYTLLLERSRAYDEALKAIAEYMGLACDDIGSKADREAIAKRQIRITAKKSRI